MNNKIVYILVFIILAVIVSLGVLILRPGTKTTKCGIENCHGLDIVCGPNIPEVCTEIYMLGDFCRQYARCETVDEQCGLAENTQFNKCKACMEECGFTNDCDQECRNQILSDDQETMQVKVYFASNKDIPDCARVEEFTRTIPYAQAVGTAAINEMLKGPTMKEGEVATNAIPKGTKLLSLYIENGTAYAEFSKEIQNYGGGSCNALAIRAQIEKTLKQFPTVDRVEISVPGVTNPLQP